MHGLASLECAIDDVIGGIKAAPRQLLELGKVAVTNPVASAVVFGALGEGGAAARVSSRLVTGAARALSKRIGKNSVEVLVEGGFRRVDLVGKAHKGVPTPHVHEYILHTNPQTGAARYKKEFIGAATREDVIEASRAVGQTP